MTDNGSVLMVDDEPEILQATALRLRAAGYRTQSAPDAATGIAAAASNQPDLILMDVRMPQQDGLSALADLKRRPDTVAIPVVMLSASVVDEEAALDAGARFFLRKPYRSETLLTAVRTAIGHDDQPKEPTGRERQMRIDR